MQNSQENQLPKLLDVVEAKFIGKKQMSYSQLFEGYSSIKVLTYSDSLTDDTADLPKF